MIRKTVYFRDEEDLAKFNALANKAEWLHEHLNDHLVDTTVQIIPPNWEVLGNEPTVTEPEETA